jgi:hypothetical protein
VPDGQVEAQADLMGAAAGYPTLLAGRLVSRRQFLGGGAAIALAGAMYGRPGGTERLAAALAGADVPEPRGAGDRLAASTTPSFTFAVERDTDLLQLDMSFYNFVATTVSGVVALDPVIPAAGVESGPRGTTTPTGLIVVQFPPQAIGETAYLYAGKDPATDQWPVDPPPVLSVLAGPSRLCFTTTAPVEFPTMTAADLLDWSAWNLLVPAVAELPVSTPPVAPTNPVGQDVTYIEYPYGVFLAPPAYFSVPTPYVTTFVGSGVPTRAGGPNVAPLVSPTGLSDCWTASMQQTALPAGGGPGTPVTAQAMAVWSRDFASTAPDATPTKPITY